MKHPQGRTSAAMLTQCPDCHTLFRIRDEQLRAADGRARCCRCNSVFDALANLRAEEDPAPRRGVSTRRRSYASQPPPPVPKGREVPRPFAPAGGEAAPTVVGAAVREPIMPPPEPPATESTAPPVSTRTVYATPVSPIAETEPDLAAESPDEDTEPRFAGPFSVETDVEPFEIPEDLPEIEPSEEGPPSAWIDKADPPLGPSAWAQLGWGLGALLLLCTAAAQVLWWDRDALAQTVQGRRIVEPFCALLGCKVVPRRALDRIRVLSRDVSPHPTQPQALLVMLVMSNEAAFAQPFPLLQITLYDEQERPVGQRRFTPQEYLGVADVPQMKPDQAVYVRLELVDPGRAVTGFRFDFL
jgi:predicted Zn finger-like uncharacterized protein